MSKIYKCYLCGNPILDGEVQVYKNRHAHMNCFNTSVKMMSEEGIKKANIAEGTEKAKRTRSSVQNVKSEFKSPISEEDDKARVIFLDYLQKLLLVPKVPPKSLILASKYRDNGYTWKNMKLAIQWYIEVQNHTINQEQNIVALIPYIYDDAKKYYEDLEYIQTINKGIDTNNFYKETTYKFTPKTSTNTKKIDISKFTD